MSKVYDKICFYSHFGNGDLFNSREIVRDIVQSNPSTYFYAHSKSPRMFADIPQITHSKLYDFMRSDKAYIIGQENDLYINTWIGRDPKYVLPGIGCTLPNYIAMFQEILKEVGLKPLQGDEIDYIPQIIFKYFEISGVDKFLKEHGRENNVLICNGNSQSNQSINFSFEPVIIRLVNDLPQYKFIITEPINYSADNLFYTGDITKTSDGFDLPEISYLSLNCNPIIGRPSGPCVFCQTIENMYLSRNKVFLIFSKHINSASLSFSKNLMRILYHSTATDEESVYNNIKSVVLNV